MSLFGWLFDSYYRTRYNEERAIRAELQNKVIHVTEKWKESESAYHSVLASLRVSRDKINELEETLLGMECEEVTLEDVLFKLDRTAEEWKTIDDKVNSYFKADVCLVDVDMAVYRTNFMGSIYNHLLENGGDYQYEDFSEMKTCSVEDLPEALDRDFISEIGYVEDLWDCENRADAVKSRMARIYGITSIRRVCGKTAESNHAFCYFYNLVGEWVFEPGNNVLWALNTAGLPDIYKVENWYDYR